MTSHHPSDDLLVDRLRGSLPHPASRVLDAHLDLCPACRRLADTLNDIAGAALAELDAAPLSAGLLDDTLAKIAAIEPDLRAARAARAASAIPSGFERWRWVGPGVRLAKSQVAVEGGWRTFLLKVEPGRSVPAHGHDGVELTCVLQGGFTDGERSFRKGDFAEAGGPSLHRLTAAEGEPCICMLATQAPLKWHGLTRWIQPVIGI